jgi:hypothetical protein
MPTKAAFDNGITVYHDGKPRDLELSQKQAEKLAWFVNMASPEDSVPDTIYPISQEKCEQRIQRSSTLEEQADNFKTHLSRLTKLDCRELAMVFALADLIEYGDSWMLEIIKDLLLDVLCEGPASALTANPREVLADVAYNLFDWWDTIDTARSRVARHPELFPLAPPEPPPAEQTTQPATMQPAKGRSVRKPRKKVSRAA